jgi:hypothetical protein
MRGVIRVALLGAVLGIGGAPARAQGLGGAINTYTSYGISPYYAAPGFYGTSYGLPGFGAVRTYTAFSSPYGPGYGYGYAPYSLLPGTYGVRLWRPGFSAPGYVYGASFYRTFLAPYQPNYWGFQAPIGLYAPAFGPPPGYFTWY